MILKSRIASAGAQKYHEKNARNNHFRWGDPDVCRFSPEQDKVYYLISVPQDWVTTRSTEWQESKGFWISEYCLKAEYAIDQYCVVMASTVDHPGTIKTYPYDWAWVKTTLAGAPKLLNRLGYHVFDKLPTLPGDTSKEEVREKARLHGVDMRLIDIKDMSYIRGVECIDTYMCFRDDDDACLMRLAI